MKILHSRNEFEGTCYIELLPGKYCGTCWNEESLFFTEEDFGYIEPIIEKHYKKYDHYAFNEISSDIWKEILIDFIELKKYLETSATKETLENSIGFIFSCTKTSIWKTLMKVIKC